MGTKKRFIFSLLTGLLCTFLLINIAGAISLPLKNPVLKKFEFLGTWKMQTIVTHSKCPYIIVGSTTESKLEIKPERENNSILRGLWKGGKWSKSSGIIRVLNEKEAITERITKLKTKDKTNWKAVLIDHLNLDEKDIMHSESIIIQYKNDIPVGEYKTFSILTKIE